MLGRHNSHHQGWKANICCCFKLLTTLWETLNSLMTILKQKRIILITRSHILIMLAVPLEGECGSHSGVPHGNHLRAYSEWQNDGEWKRPRNRKGRMEGNRNCKKKNESKRQKKKKHMCSGDASIRVSWKVQERTRKIRIPLYFNPLYNF